MRMISKNVFQGDSTDADSVANGKNDYCNAVLFLGLQLPPYLQNTKNVVVHVPMRDESEINSPDKFFMALEILYLMIDDRDCKVLIACDAGMSRSVLLSLLFLISLDYTWDEAELMIKQLCPQSDIEASLFNQMREAVKVQANQLQRNEPKGLFDV